MKTGVGALLAALLISACAAVKPAGEPDHNTLAAFDFDPKRPLAQRVALMPDRLLARWRKGDDAPEYAAYLPSEPERREFAAALDGLPPRLKSVLDERLIAFYFVSSLKGNGVTTWVLDSSSRTYAYMILNPAGFHKTLSQILTERERSAFGGAADLSVDAGTASGILYTVSHECLHAFDYAAGVTPYTDPGEQKFLGRSTDLSWDVWKGYRAPLPQYDFPDRAKLHFYGFGPALAPADAPRACAALAKSPFASFYGSTAWAEDAAELFVARHLVRDLGLPYRVSCAGTQREPMADPVVRARAEKLLAPVYAP